MKELAIHIINSYGYWGILMLTTLESIFPIIPAEIILTLSGFMTTYTDMSKNGVILFATLGEYIGAIILYSAGYFFSQERLENFIEGKISQVIGFKKEDIYKSKDWFIHKGKYTVLFCRCIPVFGSLISIPAGMAQMNFIQFSIFTIIGITIWNTVLVTLGVAAKASWEIFANGASTFSTIAAYIFVIFVLINGLLLFYKNIKSKQH